jgi:hypothetical protein
VLGWDSTTAERDYDTYLRSSFSDLRTSIVSVHSKPADGQRGRQGFDYSTLDSSILRAMTLTTFHLRMRALMSASKTETWTTQMCLDLASKMDDVTLDQWSKLSNTLEWVRAKMDGRPSFAEQTIAACGVQEIATVMHDDKYGGLGYFFWGTTDSTKVIPKTGVEYVEYLALEAPKIAYVLAMAIRVLNGQDMDGLEDARRKVAVYVGHPMGQM